MTFKTLFQNFIYDKTVAGLAPKSLDAYRYQLIGFLRFVGEDTEVESISRKKVDDYILSIRKSNLHKGTLHSYVRSVRIILVYASKYCSLSFDPKEIVVPKSPKKQLRIYTDDEVAYIFNSVENSIPWLEYRDRAILALMYDSGLRLIEVCRMQLEDIQFKNRRLLVHGKGDKERYVPLGDFSAALIMAYMDICPYDIIDEVFLSNDGNVLTTNAIKLMVARIKKKLPFPLSSHKLRHNFATNYCIDQLERFGHIDSLSLKSLMGHESLQTTEKYLHYASNFVAVKSSSSHLDTISLPKEYIKK